MIRKTDKYFKRKARVYGLTYTNNNDKVMEIVRRETWWLLFIIPLYIRETVEDKPR